MTKGACAVLEAVGFINVTRQCNVDCKRCYLTEHNRLSSERLPLPTLEAFLANPFWEGREVTLIWEGGEPTLVGHAAMRRYCSAARRILPHARQTMVTNCFNVPDWLLGIIKDEFQGNVETTYATGHKFSLAGNEEHYQRKFIAGLNLLWRSGIQCPVNVELNRETVSAGVDVLAGVILGSDCKVWEFDVSVDFRTFLANPVYTADTVPVLPLTVSYKEVWRFLSELKSRWGARFKEAGISIGAFEQQIGQTNNQFNVACEHRFLTLNPDGVVTTNPLYSDLPGTHLVNVNDAGLDPILANRNRLRRVLADRKRAACCKACPHYTYCKGGPSHVAVTDGSGECAGGKGMWDQLLEMSCA